MIIFWILTAGLMGLALFYVALPLLQPEQASEAPEQDELNLAVFKQRLQELDADLAGGFLEQDQYAAARRDLERDLLRDIPGEIAAAGRRGPSGGRWMALVLAVAVPTSAVLIYKEIGHREIIERFEGVALRGETPQTLIGPDGEELPPLEVLVQRLEERLAEDPNNVDGWLMIGRTYFTMRRPGQALDAVSKAYALAPERPDVMLAFAEATAANNNNSLEGEPAALIERVLEAEPDNASARWLSGMLYYQRGQYTAAATAWQRILDEMDPASEDAADMREMITEARTRAGAPATNAAAETDSSAATSGGTGAAAQQPETAAPASEGASEPVAAASVTADVSLDQAISAGAAPDDIVFVFARALVGPPMPLAVQRVRVKDLPTRVTLDDSMAMMPEMSLSAFPQVMIGARVARSGQATPQPGDLEGETGPIDSAGNTQVAVTINRIRP
ncbi:MAG: c-type cytochrome biogenesis protein CcmI [Thiocapsa sp.]|uniref:c-type cytochrome biogenesis protein CcmI n=1 Tax=Thiocapsa sp. TaxID=2024551 RepID=UPI001BD089A6|nr:c-type cytochrome biogenesis protein CcmI [Thiocapsa sp.]QVL49222.1 MAG: c-type cytochrome biogenesis protein CcmI [Thiocapsa sp.]